MRKTAKPKRCLKDRPLSVTSDSSTFSPQKSTLDISTKHTDDPAPKVDSKKQFAFSLDTRLSTFMPSVTTVQCFSETQTKDWTGESCEEGRQSKKPKGKIDEVMENAEEIMEPTTPESRVFRVELQKSTGFCSQLPSRPVSWNSANSLASSWSNENSTIQFEDLVQQAFGVEDSKEPELRFSPDESLTQAIDAIHPSTNTSPTKEVLIYCTSVDATLIYDTTKGGAATKDAPIEENPTYNTPTDEGVIDGVTRQEALTGVATTEVASLLDAPINETVVNKGATEPSEHVDSTNLLILIDDEPAEIIPPTSSNEEPEQVPSVGDCLAQTISSPRQGNINDALDGADDMSELLDELATFQAPTTSSGILSLPNSSGDITAAQSKAYDDLYLSFVLPDDTSEDSASTLEDHFYTALENLDNAEVVPDQPVQLCSPTGPLKILSLPNSSVDISADQSKAFDRLYLASLLPNVLVDGAVSEMQQDEVDAASKEMTDTSDVADEPVPSNYSSSPSGIPDSPRVSAGIAPVQPNEFNGLVLPSTPPTDGLVEGNTANTTEMKEVKFKAVEFCAPTAPSGILVLPNSSSEVTATHAKSFDELYLLSTLPKENVVDDVCSVAGEPVNIDQSEPATFQPPTTPSGILGLPNSFSEVTDTQAKCFDELYLSSTLPEIVHELGEFIAPTILTGTSGLQNASAIQGAENSQDGQARVHSASASRISSLPDPSTEVAIGQTPGNEILNPDLILPHTKLDEPDDAAVAEYQADSLPSSGELIEFTKEADTPQVPVIEPKRATRSIGELPAEEPLQEQPAPEAVENEPAAETHHDAFESEVTQESPSAPSSDDRTSATLSILPNLPEEEQLQLVQDDIEQQDLNTFLGTTSLHGFLEILDCDDEGNTTREAITDAFIALSAEEKILNEEFSSGITKRNHFGIDERASKHCASKLVQVRNFLGTTSLRGFLKLVEFNEGGRAAEESVVEAFHRAAELEKEKAMSSKAKASAKRRAARLVAGLKASA